VVTTFVAFWAAVMDLAPGRGTIVAFRRQHTVGNEVPPIQRSNFQLCHSPRRGGGGVLVFVGAARWRFRAVSNAQQREWVIENSAFAEVSSFRHCRCCRRPWKRCGWICRWWRPILPRANLDQSHSPKGGASRFRKRLRLQRTRPLGRCARGKRRGWRHPQRPSG